MSRPIKFRAWNTEMNNMVFPSLEFGREIWPCTYKRIIKSETNEDGYIEEVTLEMVSVDHILQSPEFEVMQFTGITDRNGVDIYEGDVVKRDKYIMPLKVVWNSLGRFCLEFRDGTQTDFIPYPFIKVIGNIYEHPELLEGGNPA